ncbi:unnamed protein product [Cyclocybe aegerita]|uniref:Uncharacterized protein n=1 Tax=Cyclocybe aegerita TaxID=1973307 RepID=A0A8S0X1Q7_CYCAE|nr:unnamed protein product [Cyclocybe aegerita]
MAKESFPIDAAQVVGLFMESVFYGCLRVLLWKEGWFKPLHAINKKMLVAALLMFLFASLDVAFHLRHNLDAFIWFEGDPVDAFEETSNWINVMKMVCYVLQTFVGDAILLYRCFIVYSKRWLVIVLPTLLWLGTTVCGAMTIYVEATLDTSGKLLNASNLIPFITSMLCLTLATNVLTTGLIVHRIWKIRVNLKHRSTVVTNSPLTNVMVVLIESGLMYTLSIIILFGLYMASSNGQYGVSNAVVQIIGITFNLIITSVDRGDSTQPTSQTNRSISHSASQGNVPLHMINIQTTVNRYPDPAPTKSHVSDIETASSNKVEWNSPQ